MFIFVYVFELEVLLGKIEKSSKDLSDFDELFSYWTSTTTTVTRDTTKGKGKGAYT